MTVRLFSNWIVIGRTQGVGEELTKNPSGACTPSSFSNPIERDVEEDFWATGANAVAEAKRDAAIAIFILTFLNFSYLQLLYGNLFYANRKSTATECGRMRNTQNPWYGATFRIHGVEAYHPPGSDHYQVRLTVILYHNSTYRRL
jgi:hypothetical protein